MLHPTSLLDPHFVARTLSILVFLVGCEQSPETMENEEPALTDRQGPTGNPGGYAKGPRGKAMVVVVLNDHPVVAKMAAIPAWVDPGFRITLSAEAADKDGDGLSFAWRTGCPGEFESSSGRRAFFRPGELAVAACEFAVEVSDGRGGMGTGRLILPVGRPVVNVAPIVGPGVQSLATVAPGQKVALHVEARDPEGQPLTFAWTADQGVVVDQVDFALGSDAVFVAPAQAGRQCTITVVVTDPLGGASRFPFHVDVEN